MRGTKLFENPREKPNRGNQDNGRAWSLPRDRARGARRRLWRESRGGDGSRLPGENPDLIPGPLSVVSSITKGGAAFCVCKVPKMAGNGFVSKCFMGKFHLDGTNLD